MLPLLSLVAVGTFAAMTLTRSKRRAESSGASASRAPKKSHPPPKKNRKALPPGTFQIVGQTLLEDTESVLATEDVPMDNRFGNQPFVSEHEFLRSAKVSMVMQLGNHLGSDAGAALLPVLKAELRSRLARKLGVKMGAQVSRHVRLRFTVEPGKRVLYRVIWKQSAQRGVFDVGVGRHLYQVPYMVTFGLAHVVQSVAMEEA